MPNNATLPEKYRRLADLLRSYQSLTVAFSGGVDSSLLLAVAFHELGDQVVAMTARSQTHPTSEIAEAVKIAALIGARHIIFDSNEMNDADFIANGLQRCYHCKKQMFSAMLKTAREIGSRNLAHGANLDDHNDFRPGFKAAGELGVAAPLVEAGFDKADIRELARQLDLPNWNRPAMSCLATRIPYGTPISEKKLRQIERAEAVLGRLGIKQCRVRHHGKLARIEIDPLEMDCLNGDDLRLEIVRRFKALGFDFICLDLEGYVSGKMNL